MTGAPATTLRLSEIKRSPAQLRTLNAALALFAEHGVSGTSLQMIADATGVTKAAIYYQFNTKDEIVLAVAEKEMAALEQAGGRAEAASSRAEARATLLREVVDMAVDRRALVRALQNDPVMVRLLATHTPIADLTQRAYALILDDGQPQSKVSAALMAGAIGAAVVHPMVDDLDDETLRRELLAAAGRLFAVEP